MKQFSKLINEKLKLTTNSKLHATKYSINNIKLDTPYKCFTIRLDKIDKIHFGNLSYDLICDKKPFKDSDDKYTVIVHWEQNRMSKLSSFKLHGDPSLEYKFLVLFHLDDIAHHCVFILFEDLKEAEKFKNEYEINTSYQNEIKQLYNKYLKL